MKIPSGLKPNPKLDQHFLVDEEMISGMIAAAGISETDIVLDVGAGIGTITSRIPKCKGIVAIEIDPLLVKELDKIDGIRVIQGNALTLLKTIRFDVLLSNLPYTIAEPLIKLLYRLEFRSAVLLLPKNFVKRMTDNGILLGLICQEFFNIEVLMDVMPASYEPQPDIVSCMVRLTRKKASLVQLVYLQQDKKVKNALREALIEMKSLTKRTAKDAISDLQISILEKQVACLAIEDYIRISAFGTRPI